jgi:two-component system, LytTR family, response regulator
MDQVIDIRIPKGIKKIHIGNIICIKAYKRCVSVLLSNGTEFETCHKLKWFEEKLSQPDFFRCHKSYIVNFFYIEYRVGRQFYILNHNHAIPISKARFECTQLRYNEYLVLNYCYPR